MKRKKWFWGLFFLAAAVCVVAAQVGAFASIGLWSIVAGVLLAALCIDSLADLNFFGTFISLGLLYLLFEKPLRLPHATFWPLMFAAVLAAIGLSILVHGRRWHGKAWKEHRHGHGPREEENVDGNAVYLRSSFNETCKYLHAEQLEKACLDASFGKMSVYFDQVKLSPGGADVLVDVRFGLLVLYFPASWRVEDRMDTGFGSVKNDGRAAAPEANAPVVTLRGKVSFSGLEIHYV